MEQSYQQLLDILSAHIRNQAPEQLGNPDWVRLSGLAKIHNVTGMLGYMTYSHKLCDDGKVLSELRQSCFATMAKFNQKYAHAMHFLDTLSDHGIDHIIMKGAVLRNLYPIPELRTFSDIDLVIRKEDRARTHQLMLDLGFQIKTDWEPVYSYYKGAEHYEIHTELLEVNVSDKVDYKSYFQNPWPHTKCIRDHRYELTPEFHFLYLITHIAKHIHGSGAGIRMYLDIAVFLQVYGASLDWRYVFKELDFLQLRKFAETVLRAVEIWFQVPSPVPLLKLSDEIMDAFTEFTLEAGIFGKNNRDSAVAALKNESSPTGTKRLRYLIRRIFPSADRIKRRYTYLEKYPWLLPVAWIHRLTKNFHELNAFGEELDTILNVEDENIRRLRNITKSIGL